jgi:catechol-2,3-dioxygenase
MMPPETGTPAMSVPAEIPPLAPGQTHRTPRVQRTHVALYVRDPVASGRWYGEVLGMEQVASEPRWTFMSFGQKHHDIALIKAQTPAELGTIGLQHYGLEIDGDLDELRRLYGMLLRRGVPIVKITDHKAGIGVYFTDPDGNRLEFFCETEKDDAKGKALMTQYNAASDPTPLDPLFD